MVFQSRACYDGERTVLRAMHRIVHIPNFPTSFSQDLNQEELKNCSIKHACPVVKVEKILKGSLDSITSPSVKIEIMGRKVCLR